MRQIFATSDARRVRRGKEWLGLGGRALEVALRATLVCTCKNVTRTPSLQKKPLSSGNISNISDAKTSLKGVYHAHALGIDDQIGNKEPLLIRRDFHKATHRR